MRSDTEIKNQGLTILTDFLGEVEAEKFISLMIKEQFNYTDWQRSLWENKSLETIHEEAAEYRKMKRS